LEQDEKNFYFFPNNTDKNQEHCENEWAMMEDGKMATANRLSQSPIIAIMSSWVIFEIRRKAI